MRRTMQAIGFAASAFVVLMSGAAVAASVSDVPSVKAPVSTQAITGMRLVEPAVAEPSIKLAQHRDGNRDRGDNRRRGGGNGGRNAAIAGGVAAAIILGGAAAANARGSGPSYCRRLEHRCEDGSRSACRELRNEC